MESTTDMHEPTTSAAAVLVGADDLISELTDDLLLRILSFLPSASEVARTSVLSRRWRHLWPNAVALRFTVGSEPSFNSADVINDARRLIAAADATLARRAGGPDVEDLELSFVYSSDDDNIYLNTGRNFYNHYHAADITSAQVAAWLRFGAQRVAGCFTLTVPVEPRGRWCLCLCATVPDGEEEDEEQAVAAAMEEDVVAAAKEEVDDEPMEEYEEDEEMAAAKEEVDDEPMEEYEEDEEITEEEEEDDDDDEEERFLFVELPCSVRAQEMSLTLARATLTVPAASAGAFRSLTDIMLSHVRLEAGNGDGIRLGHLLSSSCSPRLRRMELRYIEGLAALRLDAAATLAELRLFRVRDLRTLDADAPGLRCLRVMDCGKDAVLRVSAPELEVLACDAVRHAGQLRFEGGGAASVRRIEDLPLYSHRLVPCNDEGYGNSAALWFLRHCTSLNRLSVQLNVSWFRTFENINGEEIGHEDMMTDIPELPSIRKLRIDVKTLYTDGHRIGASVAKLIAKCTSIEYLFINIDAMDEECFDPNCICDHPKGWKNQKISLQNLRIIQICDCQLLRSDVNLVCLLLVSAPALERLTVIQETTFNEDEVVEFDLPCYGGHWAPCVWECDTWGLIWAKKYTWTRVSGVVEETTRC